MKFNYIFQPRGKKCFFLDAYIYIKK